MAVCLSFEKQSKFMGLSRVLAVNRVSNPFGIGFIANRKSLKLKRKEVKNYV